MICFIKVGICKGLIKVLNHIIICLVYILDILFYMSLNSHVCSTSLIFFFFFFFSPFYFGVQSLIIFSCCPHLIATFGLSSTCYNMIFFIVLLRRFICMETI